MNLAIVIGVSEYITQKQLPACKNDALIIKELLNESKKYKDILYITEETHAQNIKTEIIDFINNYKDEGDFEELFFYFSGHGWFDRKEFRYICSDFDVNNINRTSLKNSELDDIIKVLGAKLAIKVVDACNSGTRYIKGDMDEEAVKSDMKKVYNNCYFMFSCQQEQSSIANSRISYFTESFVKAVINFVGENIRYRDIMDYVADEFSNIDMQQEPFYVTQSTNMEYFINASKQLKEKISNRLDSIVIVSNQDDSKLEKSPYDVLQEESLKYCKSKDEIFSVFDFIKSEFNKYKIESTLSEIYIATIEESDETYAYLPSIRNVAYELANDKYSDFFVDFQYVREKQKRKVRKNNIIFSFNDEENYKYVEEEVEVAKYYWITMNGMEYNRINIEISSSMPNINSVQCNVIFAFSRRYINIYYYYDQYIEKEWEQYAIPQNVKWNKIECEIKDNERLKSNIEQIRDEINKYLLENINKKVDLARKKEVVIDSTK